VDGISGVDIATVLFDTSSAPAPVAPPAQEWVPRPLPSRAQLLADALLERATVVDEIVRGVRAMLRGPRHLATRAVEVAAGMGALALVGLEAAPESPFNVRIGPHRRFTWVRASLEDFKAIKNVLGGTVNDVVLAAVAGALGSYMRAEGREPEDLVLKAMVPVSVRAEVERGELGNRVAAMWAPLPVGVRDPAERLEQIRLAMADIKESGQAMGAQALTQLSGFAPPTIMAQAARLQARQRLFNLVITNVPGPQMPLYVLGRELLYMAPMVPLAENTALGIAVMSYNGQMTFGLNADYDALPAVESLADALREAIEALRQVAGVSKTRPRAPARRRAVSPERRLRVVETE
jgi:WS/DGAT/MGAT family acyltransferase